MEMKYTVHQIMAVLANLSMVASSCQGDFIGGNKTCRPQQCQTPASFKPPQYCMVRNNQEWDKCRKTLTAPSASNKGDSLSVSGPPYVSKLSTGLTTAEDATALNVVITYNTRNQYVDWVVNMTSPGDEHLPGDSYYYWLPDQRIVHLTAGTPQKKHIDIKLSYRGLEPCRCNHHGCYLYVLRLIPLSQEYSVLTYYITVFNITKNAKLSHLSLSWKSAIAVAINPELGDVNIVVESLPSRLSPANISYRVTLYKYPAQNEPPVQSYEIPRTVATYTHTFKSIAEGDYYVEVTCDISGKKSTKNPWSRSQPFSVPPNDTIAIKAKTIEGESDEPRIITSISIVAALAVVIVLTVGIYILHRKLTASRQKVPIPTLPFDENENRNNVSEPEENVNDTYIDFFKLEQKFIDLNSD